MCLVNFISIFLLWLCLVVDVLSTSQVHFSCLTEILNNFAHILPHTGAMKPTFANLLVFLSHYAPSRCELRFVALYCLIV